MNGASTKKPQMFSLLTYQGLNFARKILIALHLSQIPSPSLSLLLTLVDVCYEYPPFTTIFLLQTYLYIFSIIKLN